MEVKGVRSVLWTTRHRSRRRWLVLLSAWSFLAAPLLNLQAATITVTVKDFDTYQVLSGASVDLYEDPQDYPYYDWDGGTKTTDSNGQATWYAVPDDIDLLVDCSKTGYSGITDFPYSATVYLTSLNVTVTIAVQNTSNGQSLSGASVHLYQNPAGWDGGTKTTDSSGQATWNNVPPSISLADACSKSGFNGATDTGFNSGSYGTSHTTFLRPLQAHLYVQFNAFFPFDPIATNSHPSHVAFDVYNQGPDYVSTSVSVEIFFSRNSTFGDSDDIKIGQLQYPVAIASGANANVDLWYNTTDNPLSSFTVPSSACGYYTNAYLRVTFPSGSGYTDPGPASDNVGAFGLPVYVDNPAGQAPSVQSVMRQSPSTATNNASSVTWRVTFTQPVTGVDLSDFSLILVSGSISGASKSGLQIQSSTVADVTVNTGSGSGVLRLDVLTPVTIYNTCQVPLSPSYIGGQTYTIDRTGPAVVNVGPVSPDPMHGPVSFVNVTFSKPILQGTFTYQRVALTDNGVAVPLNSTIDVSSVTGNTYRLNNVAAFTTAPGNYVITVNGAGITDSLGNAGTGSASDSWNNILAGSQTVYISKAYSGSDPNGSVSTPFKTVTDGYNAAQAGNAMTMFSGNYNEAILMNKQLLLQATNGTVNIGVP